MMPIRIIGETRARPIFQDILLIQQKIFIILNLTILDE